MSSDSELTDISEEYEDAAASGSNKRRRTVSEYRITNALQTPNTSSYATCWLATLMKDGDIKLNPEYQRDVVWSDLKQSKLIDSILRNYYIPPIIFSLSTDKTGNQTRVCIDGKQRLTSISRFIDGLIPHKDGGTSYYFTQADSTKKCRLLPENLCKQFRNKQIVCIEYRELSAAAERDIFQRVQLGMALTTGEQFQSYDGPIAKFIHRVHTKLFDENQLDKLIGLAIDRGKGFQNLVRTVACIARLPNYVHPSQLQQTRLLQCQGMSEEQVSVTQRKSERALGILWDIANDAQLRNIAFPLPTRTSRTSPVEFCFAALLIAMHMDIPNTGIKELAERIGRMNAVMRAIYSDMRTNNKVSMSFWEYINNPQMSVPQPESALSPKIKRIRIKAPTTPQTALSQDPLAHLRESAQPLRAGKQKSVATPRSESAAQFYNVFGSSQQRPSLDAAKDSSLRLKNP